ncbi:MAG: hypothetical protein F4Z30_00110 [Gemmatimonadetes bacterium]|nr:hypothetical protein [Gemmatimonadota bacterium]
MTIARASSPNAKSTTGTPYEAMLTVGRERVTALRVGLSQPARCATSAMAGILTTYIPTCQAKAWAAAAPVTGWRTSAENIKKGRQMYMATSAKGAGSTERRRPNR